MDEYLARFPEPAATLLRQLRELSLSAVPDAGEVLKWGSPAYSPGIILFVFAGSSKHVNCVFTPSTRQAFDSELSGFKTGKGPVQLPLCRPGSC